MSAAVKGLRSSYAVELWFWNGLPADFGPVAGYLFSRADESLGVGEKGGGALFFGKGATTLQGRTPIAVRTWHHLALVRAGSSVRVYLDGQPEISGEVSPAKDLRGSIWIGGRTDGVANFAGKIDEIALYDRPLLQDEISRRLALVTGTSDR